MQNKQWVLTIAAIVFSLSVIGYFVFDKYPTLLGKETEISHVDENLLKGSKSKDSTSTPKVTVKSPNSEQTEDGSNNSNNSFALAQDQAQMNIKKQNAANEIGGMNKDSSKNNSSTNNTSETTLPNDNAVTPSTEDSTSNSDTDVFGWGFDTVEHKPTPTISEVETSDENTVDEVATATTSPTESKKDEKEKQTVKLPKDSVTLTKVSKAVKKQETAKPQTKPFDVAVKKEENDASYVRVKTVTLQLPTNQPEKKLEQETKQETEQVTKQVAKNEEKPKSAESKKVTDFTYPGKEKFKIGSTGSHAEALIVLLKKSGYYTKGKETNQFTKTVSNAAELFQKDQGLSGNSVNGQLSEKSWRALYSYSKGGFPGDQYFRKGGHNDGFFVKKLEKRLKAKKLISTYTGKGEYTKTIKSAVRKFQLSKGWKGTDADGYPGPVTWRELMKK